MIVGLHRILPRNMCVSLQISRKEKSRRKAFKYLAYGRL